MQQVEIKQVMALPQQILALEKEASLEGFRFLTRLITEWNTGENRFDAPGECLMAAYLDGSLVGVGGLSIDPYAQEDIGRLRRVYVSGSSRGQNIGRSLVNQLLEYAAGRFRVVRLSTDTSSGAAFYVSCGFQLLNDDHATHMKILTDTPS
ncbi:MULTISPECIES: GNAT family N-acetyltransferase [unclassified Pseudomonas]|uniref:GNAT family N-acetyltransferase n=1 Tax=unclassified Pseudomonas TaxID=196821 RepID=UPI00215EF276|nr:GNAT family N-acetyltransferase [Pseudomonas sp. B21-015]UVM53117.1 GNAT family N-acetyltransferase [Pseudomonas sp. B21-015]